jgi:hypothetical protein
MPERHAPDIDLFDGQGNQIFVVSDEKALWDRTELMSNTFAEVHFCLHLRTCNTTDVWPMKSRIRDMSLVFHSLTCPS